MLISGLQKLTLLDFPEVMAAMVFTHGCNFRCPFCHNSALVTESFEEQITRSEILDFLKSRKGLLEGVVITGGEPLIHPDIPELIKEIKDLGYLVKLDTNGTNPEMLKALVNEKLIDYVAMDIKNSPEEYPLAAGTEKFLDKVAESKSFLIEGNVPYEFRTTLVKGIHTRDSLVSLANWIKGAEKYYLQQYEDSGSVINPAGLDAFSQAEMKDFLSEIITILPSSKIRNL